MYFRFNLQLVHFYLVTWWTVTIVVILLMPVNYNARGSSENRMLQRRSIRKSANVGGSRVLECDVNYPGGEYVPHIITWRKQGLEAPIFILFDGYPPRMDTSYHGRIRLVSQASIEINDIRITDEGWYECTVLFLDKNDDMNINGTWIQLTVNSSPVLSNMSRNLLMHREGETVEMFCEATGSPLPTLTWYKDGQELRPSDRVAIAGNWVKVKAVYKLDAGLYTCIFKNIVGTVSHLIKLVIQGNGWISSAFVNKDNIDWKTGQRFMRHIFMGIEKGWIKELS